jgi:hypothetical protein
MPALSQRGNTTAFASFRWSIASVPVWGYEGKGKTVLFGCTICEHVNTGKSLGGLYRFFCLDVTYTLPGAKKSILGPSGASDFLGALTGLDHGVGQLVYP